jgi:hypothetical protein
LEIYNSSYGQITETGFVFDGAQQLIGPQEPLAHATVKEWRVYVCKKKRGKGNAKLA